ncbi:MAG TPA: hypothetical protein VGZ47_13195 [Gemmataceae bacterium]|nr:hypothetical protein [Gemmataceae bacterium]
MNAFAATTRPWMVRGALPFAFMSVMTLFTPSALISLALVKPAAVQTSRTNATVRLTWLSLRCRAVIIASKSARCSSIARLL